LNVYVVPSSEISGIDSARPGINSVPPLWPSARLYVSGAV
jgi:hypothetical protein